MQFPKYSDSAVKFAHPFTSICYGSTGAGKTHFLLNLIANKDSLISPSPQRVIYSYKRYQPDAFDPFIKRGVEFIKGHEYTLDPRQNNLLLIDDAMLDCDLKLGQLFSVDSHHLNCSIVFVTHNLYHQSKEYRTAVLNTTYLLLFKSPRGVGQVSVLARQLYGNERRKSNALINAYTHATSRRYGYLLLDLSPGCPEQLRLRSKILPCEGPDFCGTNLTICYPV